MRSAGDLTAAAHIRNAAMRLFAQRGAAAVSVRQVAAAAGVSPSLVIHHYKSKDGLRAAVDQHAIGWLERMLAEFSANPDAAQDASGFAAMFAAEFDDEPDMIGYLRRVLLDGGAAAEALFRRMFEISLDGVAAMERVGLVRPSDDPQARAAFLLVNDIAVVLLRKPITAVLGVDPLSRQGLGRWSATVLDVYSRGVFGATGTQGPDTEES